MWRRWVSSVRGLANHPQAIYWMMVIAFIESSFFPIPVDVLFVPMLLLQDKNKGRLYPYYLAFWATIVSCLGGIFGYFVGFYGYQALGLPLLEFLGKAQAAQQLQEAIQGDVGLLWLLFLSSGFVHVPPIKVVSLLAGAAHIDLSFFILTAIVGRGTRFFLLAWLCHKHGDMITTWLQDRRLQWFLGGVVIALVGGWYAVRTIL